MKGSVAAVFYFCLKMLMRLTECNYQKKFFFRFGKMCLRHTDGQTYTGSVFSFGNGTLKRTVYYENVNIIIHENQLTKYL